MNIPPGIDRLPLKDGIYHYRVRIRISGHIKLLNNLHATFTLHTSLERNVNLILYSPNKNHGIQELKVGFHGTRRLFPPGRKSSNSQ